MFPNVPMSGYLKLEKLVQQPIRVSKAIVVANISNSEIEFPAVTDQLFVYRDTEQQWTSIPEKMRFEIPWRLYPIEDINSKKLKDAPVVIEPDLKEFERPITVRVVVIGEIIENGQNTGKKVGGYIDLEFK